MAFMVAVVMAMATMLQQIRWRCC